MQRLNKQFRLARIALGLSQGEFANLVGIETFLICEIEEGEEIPREALNVTYATLLIIKELIVNNQIEMSYNRKRVIFDFVEDLNEMLKLSIVSRLKGCVYS